MKVEKRDIPRVLQVFTILNRGGAESMIMNYYRKIDRSKIQFDFLVHREEKGIFEDEIKSMGGRIFRAPSINPLNSKAYYRFLNEFFKNSYPYKIIHSHLNTFSVFPLRIAKENNIPIRIAHAHIALEPLNMESILDPRVSLINKIKNGVKYNLRNKIHKSPNYLFSCGIKAGEWLYGKEAEMTLLNNAIDSKKFQYSTEIRNKIREDLDLQDQLVIGHIGRFNHQKNHLFLLEIFKQVSLLEANAVLLLIGDGDLRASIEKKAKELDIHEKVHFLGIREDISDILQGMDVFVFPSHYEGLPVTLIETQASGLKIFASENITNEVSITDDIRFISLDQSAKYWAEKIFESTPYNRKDNYDLIKNNGYDIISNAAWLENFYIQKLESTNER